MTNKYKIGAFGSADGDFSQIESSAIAIGHALPDDKVIVLTGATTGLPHVVAMTAHNNGCEIWGYPPLTELNDQSTQTNSLDLSIYDKLFYIPSDYPFAKDVQVARKYRNVTSTANCDAGIIISGRWGTLNEFTNLYDMGKIIGVLTSTGGVADEIEYLNKKIHKPGKAIIILESDPKTLISKLLAALDKRL